MNESCVSRQTYWEECSEKEQIARLRQEVAELCVGFGTMASQIGRLLGHGHDSMGRVCVPVCDGDPGSSGRDERAIPYLIRLERERK